MTYSQEQDLFFQWFQQEAENNTTCVHHRCACLKYEPKCVCKLHPVYLRAVHLFWSIISEQNNYICPNSESDRTLNHREDVRRLNVSFPAG